MDNRFEAEVQTLGRKLQRRAGEHPPAAYRGVTGWLLKGAIEDEALRNALFQFVDVLPQLDGGDEVAAHLAAYLDGLDDLRPALLRLAARPGLAFVVRLAVRRLARQFLVDATPAAVAAVVAHLARVPAAVSVDAVGEAILTEAEADAYVERNARLIDWLAAAGTPHVSLKLTALTPHFDAADPAGTRSRVFARLAPLMTLAVARGATLTVDMEQYELKPLILGLFLAMLDEWPQAQWQPAIALQAYLPETAADLDRVLAAAQLHGRRLGVRLVKGAYRDQEAAWAAQRNWPCPTFAAKSATDFHFERLTQRLLENVDSLHPAIASHNLRSQAVALAWARRLGVPGTRWEAQLLYGMAEPLRDALAGEGVSLRIYVPSGDAGVGIAYLIRRLLENTASTSVLRQTYFEGADLQAVLAPPLPEAPPASGGGDDANLPLLDFSRGDEQSAFDAALRAVRSGLPRSRLLPEGKPVGHYLARNPAAPDELLGSIELGGVEYAETLLAQAEAAFPAWRDTAPAERARVLRRAADLLAARRRELAALELLTVGKNRREADADVAEAVDFIRYYADAAEGLAGWRTTRDFPGERNALIYEPLGIALAIAPWNFPLAILAGMASAALAAGNCAILKPAQPGLLVADEFRRALVEAGVPAAACPLLAAPGAVAAHLVAHPRLHLIAFTGSREVGLGILQAAHAQAPGQRHVKRVVCEMGGKNAIVVDSDADLDEAVAGILASAFGYAGQKCSACSRVIAVGSVHDRLLARLAAAAAALPWGPPEDAQYLFGPVIDKAAQAKAAAYLAVGRQEGRQVWQGEVPSAGWFVPPTIFAGILPQHRMAREEIFAPLLSILAAPDFRSALALAQDSDYALTGGVYSRLPGHLALARQAYRVGNLYLNRKITGARVGIQPFGGVALSGTGIQAGGPDYLKQFLWTRTVSTNAMRHGLIP
ncbi:MAG: bifunctional proline dehydrogenase/L-glutamate gamma-semialdehyde dehydrogenase [Rhodocyclales bacterium]|nr:bifunctional proline dehydrogenase/L-glutamate gamma-semialdehyde dehydrogenase [Rhodocyclales bacterium]